MGESTARCENHVLYLLREAVLEMICDVSPPSKYVVVFSGDAVFTSGMVAIIHSAQTSVIERIAGVPEPSSISAAKKKLNTPTASVKRKEEASNGGRGNGHNQVDAATGYKELNGAAVFTFECDARGEEEEEVYEELLRRQQLRIEELERRLLPPGSLVGVRDSATKGRRSPTLTI